MGFTGNENHDIDFDDAAILTERYRDSISSGECIGCYFGKSALNALLEQSGCVGLRYYYGLDANNSPTLVLVGVDAEGNDIIGEGKICLDHPIGCPDVCSEANPLNS